MKQESYMNFKRTLEHTVKRNWFRRQWHHVKDSAVHVFGSPARLGGEGLSSRGIESECHTRGLKLVDDSAQ